MNGPDFQYDGLKAFAPVTYPATDKKQGLMSAADKAKLDALYQAPPSARVYNGANTSIANAAVTALSFDSERFDTHAFHDPATHPDRLTVPSGLGGLYLIGGHVTWTAAGGTRRQAALQLNGTTALAVDDRQASGLPQHSLTTLYRLAAGDYVQLTVYQDSGGALNVNTFTNFSPEFWIMRVGD